jgi:hypothetical protein
MMQIKPAIKLTDKSSLVELKGGYYTIKSDQNVAGQTAFDKPAQARHRLRHLPYRRYGR